MQVNKKSENILSSLVKVWRYDNLCCLQSTDDMLIIRRMVTQNPLYIVFFLTCDITIVRHFLFTFFSIKMRKNKKKTI